MLIHYTVVYNIINIMRKNSNLRMTKLLCKVITAAIILSFYCDDVNSKNTALTLLSNPLGMFACIYLIVRWNALQDEVALRCCKC